MTKLSHCPECGCVFEKPRSRPQHGRFFSVIEKAFDQWPESHEFQPRNSEHLRFWLEMKAGHFTVPATITPSKVSVADLCALLSAFVRVTEDQRTFLESDGSTIVVKRTKSISFASMSQDDFNRLSSDVDEILRAEGLDPDALLTERAA